MHDGFWTYIVSSRSGLLYIGMTNNIERRMWEHKSGEFEKVNPRWADLAESWGAEMRFAGQALRCR